MWKVAEILMLIFLPLVWGMGVDYVFERIRRKRSPSRQQASPYDWII